MRAALAQALAVDFYFFSSPLSNPVRIEQTHFRKLRSTTVQVTQEVLSYGTMFEALVSLLDTVLELPVVNFPEFPVSSEIDIEIAAEKCRVHWGLGVSGPISNMTRVVENAGAIVAIFDGVSEKVDALSFGRARPIIMRSTIKESLFRQRFDIAHECGHRVMHQGIITGDRLTENQAHRFAGAFLLPRIQFLREFPSRHRLDWQKILELKRRWKVSAAAIFRRAYDLGAINAAQYRKANIHLANTGQKKREELDSEFKLEKPELLFQCVDVLLSHGGETISSISAKLGVRPGVINRLIAHAYDGSQSDVFDGDNVVQFRTR